MLYFTQPELVGTTIIMIIIITTIILLNNYLLTINDHPLLLTSGTINFAAISGMMFGRNLIAKHVIIL